MPWFRIDDSLAFHAKTVAAGNTAMGLWVRAGAWSAQQLTDGHVPHHMIGALGGSRVVADRLVIAGLWSAEESGYRFHDWLEYQPSGAEVRADRLAKHEAKVVAGRLGGIASGVARRKQTRSRDEAEGKQNEAPTRPDPTPPGLGSPWEEEVEVELPPPPHFDPNHFEADAPQPARPALRAVGERKECKHGDQYPEYCGRCKAERRRTG